MMSCWNSRLIIEVFACSFITESCIPSMKYVFSPLNWATILARISQSERLEIETCLYIKCSRFVPCIILDFPPPCFLFSLFPFDSLTYRKRKLKTSSLSSLHVSYLGRFKADFIKTDLTLSHFSPTTQTNKELFCRPIRNSVPDSSTNQRLCAAALSIHQYSNHPK